jgi:hypothetical protein
VRSSHSVGASTNFLIHNAEVYESINAMPRMSAIPVNVAHWQGHGSPNPHPNA